MVKPNLQLHILQIEILRKLSLVPRARFNELLIDNLESVHMNYHLKKLKAFGLVQKENDYYILTEAGKDYSNRLDDIAKDIEIQPKISILVNGVRQSANGEPEYLLTKRLKHPFYGKITPLTGKVRFGETIEEAARRELEEETGLKATNLKLIKISHILRKNNKGNVLQDVIFFEFLAQDFAGEFISKLPYQENFWTTETSFNKTDPKTILKGVKIIHNIPENNIFFKEYITDESGY